MKNFLLSGLVLLASSNFIAAQCVANPSSGSQTLQLYSIARPDDRRIVGEVARIEDMFNVMALIMYSDDPSFNAEARRNKGNGLDTIVIYEGMVKFLDDKDYFLFIAVLAHEYGHVLQFKWGRQGYSMSGKEIELHADYMSGVYLQIRIPEHYLYVPPTEKYEAVLKVIRTYSDFGKYTGDPENSFVSDPHGTSEQRKKALLGPLFDLNHQIAYINRNRVPKTNGFYYVIYNKGKWWTIGEFYYMLGLKRISEES